MHKAQVPWWLYVVMPCFGAYFFLYWYHFQTLPHPPDIVPASYADGPGYKVDRVEPQSEAWNAGLRSNDRVLALDGHSAKDLASFSFSAWAAFMVNVGDQQAWTLKVSRDGALHDVSLRLRRSSLLDPLVNVPVMLGQFILLGLAGLIVIRRPQEPSARVGAWLLATIGTMHPNFLPSGIGPPWRELPAVAAAALAIPVGNQLFAPALLITFFALFPRQFIASRTFSALVWAPALILLPFLARFGYDTLYHPDRGTLLPTWFWPLWLTYYAAGVIGGVVILIVGYRGIRDINQKRRLHVLVAGTSIGLFGLFLGAFVYFGGGAWLDARVLNGLFALGLTAFLAFPLSFAYALLRHRVFDLRLIIRRGLQYALARKVILSVVPVTVALLLADLLVNAEQPLSAILRQRVWPYLLVGVLCVVTYKRRSGWLEALDRRFFRERYDANRLLREALEGLSSAEDLPGAALRVVASIEKALHPVFVAFMVCEAGGSHFHAVACAPQGHAPPAMEAGRKLVELSRVLNRPLQVAKASSGWLMKMLSDDEREYLQDAGIDLIVPAFGKTKQAGAFLVLGAKRSEEPYSGEDQDALAALATSLSLAGESHAGLSSRDTEATEELAVPGQSELLHARPQSAGMLAECPACGLCYDGDVQACASDGTRLRPTNLPRMVGGRHRLDQRLGEGGMGIVYQAEDIALGRQVGVKFIREDRVNKPEDAKRFRMEARAAAGLVHPNVITIHDYGTTEGGCAFLVMELLQGDSLENVLSREKRLDAARTLRILRGVCAAVELAHRKDLLHRDLKPGNIFLARIEDQETAKVLDFGLVKSLSKATSEGSLTASGLVVGTLFYMSPEALTGCEPDVSWDVWSLAVMSYEMLAGELPFSSQTAMDWQVAVVTGRPEPISTHLPDAAKRLDTFFLRALAREIERRPATAREFYSELQRAVD